MRNVKCSADKKLSRETNEWFIGNLSQCTRKGQANQNDPIEGQEVFKKKEKYENRWQVYLIVDGLRRDLGWKSRLDVK